MRRTLTLAVCLATTLGSGCRHDVQPGPPPAEVVTVTEPVLQIVPKLVYVPIDSNYTDPIAHQALPLGMCPLERDQLRAKLVKANGDRAAVRSIQGTPVKDSKP